MRTVNEISDAVRRGERITTDDAIILWREAPLWLLGELATERKRKASGDMVYYNRNIHIEPSNICLFNCEFCSFRRREGDADAWFMTIDEVVARAEEMRDSDITEIHIVGGVHPNHSLDSYCEMIRRVKQTLPHVAVKAYTAVELFYMIRKAEVTVVEGLRRLTEAGMDSIPGGGAEIFDETIRKRICPDKCSTEEWLAVHRAAHHMGIHTNCTMLYGHIESIEQRVDHLNRLRELQDYAPGFDAFIPLKYRSRNNRMSEIGECSVEDDLRTIAMSRIFLDNIAHIKAYWVAYGKAITEMALAFGADDIDGTIEDSTKIYSMAGADERPTMSVAELEALVRDAGFIPVERDTLYNIVERDESGAIVGLAKVASIVGATVGSAVCSAAESAVQGTATAIADVASEVAEGVVDTVTHEPAEVVADEAEAVSEEIAEEIAEQTTETPAESTTECETEATEAREETATVETPEVIESSATAEVVASIEDSNTKESTPEAESVASEAKEKNSKMAKHKRFDKFVKWLKRFWQGTKRAYKRFPILFHALFIIIFLFIVVVALNIGLKLGTRHGEDIVLPDFTGMTFDDACKLAKDKGLEIVVGQEIVNEDLDPGIITDQNPSVDKDSSNGIHTVKVKPGRRIYVTRVTLNKEIIIVPYVARQEIGPALQQLRVAGFNVDTLIYEKTDKFANQVLGQRVKGREISDKDSITMRRGSGVTLIVSYTDDNCTATVPTVVGLSLSEARRVLWSAGLNVGNITYNKSVDLSDKRMTKVCMQGIGPERVVPYGEFVSLEISADAAEIDSMVTYTAQQSKINVKLRHAEMAIMRAKEQIYADIERRRIEDESSVGYYHNSRSNHQFHYDETEYSLPPIDNSEDDEDNFFNF